MLTERGREVLLFGGIPRDTRTQRHRERGRGREITNAGIAVPGTDSWPQTSCQLEPSWSRLEKGCAAARPGMREEGSQQLAALVILYCNNNMIPTGHPQRRIPHLLDIPVLESRQGRGGGGGSGGTGHPNHAQHNSCNAQPYHTHAVVLQRPTPTPRPSR